MVTPVAFLLLFEGSQHAQESSVEPLNWVSSWVVRTCAYFSDSSKGAELSDELRLEVPALITQ